MIPLGRRGIVSGDPYCAYTIEVKHSISVKIFYFLSAFNIVTPCVTIA